MSHLSAVKPSERANLTVNGELQLGLFPGIISGSKGEEAPRLKAVVSIAVVDRITGETVKRQVPCETDNVAHLISWFRQVMTHARIEEDLKCFTKGREG